MPRPAYSSFVRHCMRFYARYPEPVFRDEAEKRKWKFCEDAVKAFSEQEQKVLLEIFREADDLSDNIYRVSDVHGIDQNRIWHLVYDLERKIAKNWGMV